MQECVAITVLGVWGLAFAALWCLPIRMRITQDKFRLKVGCQEKPHSL